jgi:hypothetical protein
VAFSEHYCEKAGIPRESDYHKPFFSSRMTRIINNAAESVGEDTRCLFEGNAVIGVILGRFFGVPFEGRGHIRIYRELCASA